MEMNDLSCAQFLAQLASKAPTPGGGGTAALVGAAGVALGNMVGCLTTGKKKYAVVEADIQALNARAEALRLELEALVQADADAFTPLAAAYGLPKDTPEQAAHKASVLEAALDGASAVPLQIMEKCAEGIALAGQYAAKGSVLAVSDAGCAAVLCKAALQAASLNVFINTKLMADRSRAAALRPEKDSDGITDGSLAGVFTNTDLGYAPCTAQACMEILKYYNVPLSGKRAVVVGRSLVVGKPAAMMLDRENATVTLCNSRTRNLPEVCRQADIVVVAMGKMAAVGADCLRAGQTVVDVGIHVNEEGKLCGDVQFDAAEPVVDAITPVPGGVGTVTTSVLVGHVVQAACKKAGVEC